MIALIRSRPGLAWFVAAGIAALAFGHFYLNYDSLYALIWGRDLADGRGPDFDVTLAPTPHPLLNLFGALLSPFGDAAPDLMNAAVAISWAALVAATYLLGARLFGPWAGAIAAVVVATRAPLDSFAVRGYVDIPFLALVVGAAALEARRPRAGTPVLVLLALAGLLRPEAWALAGLYVIWLWGSLDRAARGRAIALAAIGPLGWVAYDLIAAGDPLHSLTGTRENVEELGRETGLDDVPYTFVRYLGYLLREPGIVGAIGAVAAVLWLRDRARLPAVVFWASAAVFAVYGLAGLPLTSRYLTVPAAMLAVFCGAALVGWRLLDEGPDSGREAPRRWSPRTVRRWWRAGALAAGIVLVGLFPFQIGRIADLRESSEVRDRIQGDLVALSEARAARPTLERCPRVYLSNHRPVPVLAWELDRSPAAFISAAIRRPQGRSAFVAPRSEFVKRNYTLDRRDPKRLDATVPKSYRRVTANRSWVLYARGCGAADPH